MNKDDLTEDYKIIPVYFYINTGNITASLSVEDVSNFFATMSELNVVAQSKLFTDRFFLIKEKGVLCPNVEIVITNGRNTLGKPNVDVTITGIEDCTSRMNRVLKIDRITK